MPPASPKSLPQSLPPPRPSRWRGLLTLAVTVLVVHLWLLGAAATGPGSGPLPIPPVALQVRQIEVAATARGDAGTTPAPAAAVTARPARRPHRASVPAPAPPAARASASAFAIATPVAVPAPAAPAPPDTSAEAAQLREPRADGGAPPPSYATRLPPALTLHYAVRQGSGLGRAALHWQPAEDRYRLALEHRGAGPAATGAVSQGGLGADGLAPGRYAESRRGREQRAVNFQRESGRITFSGPRLEYPLLPGAQDRLSWMLQLPAVMEAEPALREPGSEVHVFVAGTRGDGQVWTFTVQGRQALHGPDGPLADALHLRRLAGRPYDTLLDVWLDPARHHLPARLRLQHPPAPGSTEWTLETGPVP